MVKNPKKRYMVCWNSPPLGCLNINFGLVRAIDAKAGYIIRNYKGKLIKAGTIKLGKVSILSVETIALTNGVQVAFDMGFWCLYIEGKQHTYYSSIKRRN